MGSKVHGYLRPTWAMVLLALLLPVTAWGLGLGPIQTDTRIGQNFTAQIPIVNASSNDLQGLTVGLASPQDYKNAGLSEPDYLFSLKFAVESGPSGPYVQVTASQPVRLPFLNLLVHASWSSGEVTRQYTVLLNPPMFAGGTQAAPVSAPVAPPPTSRPVARIPPRSSEKVPAATPAAQSYGPVPRGATLWGLAHQLRPSSSISINQMMIALYQANPDAFVGNINRLKAGYVLRIPSQDEITGVSFTRATQMVAQQNAAWHDWRNSRGVTTVVAARPMPPAASAVGSAAMAGAASPAASVAAAGAAASEGAGAATSSAAGRVLLTTPEVTGVGTTSAAPGTAVGGTAAAGAVAGMAASTSGSASAAAIASASTSGPVKVNSRLGALAQNRNRPSASSTAGVSTVTSVVNEPAETARSGLMGWATSPKGWIAAGVIILLLIFTAYLLRRRAAAAPAVISAAERSRGPSPGSGIPTQTATAERDRVAERAAESGGTDSGDRERTAQWPGRTAAVTAMAASSAGEEPEEAAPDQGTDTETEGGERGDIDLDLALEQPAEGEEESQGEPLDFERIVDELSTFIETYVPGGGETEPEAELESGSEVQAPEPDEAAEPTATAPPAQEEVLELSPEEEDAILGKSASPGEAEETPEIDAAGEDPVNTKLDLARAYVDLGDPESARGLLEEVLDEGGDSQREEARRLLDSLG